MPASMSRDIVWPVELKNNGEKVLDLKWLRGNSHNNCDTETESITHPSSLQDLLLNPPVVLSSMSEVISCPQGVIHFIHLSLRPRYLAILVLPGVLQQVLICKQEQNSSAVIRSAMRYDIAMTIGLPRDNGDGTRRLEPRARKYLRLWLK